MVIQPSKMRIYPRRVGMLCRHVPPSWCKNGLMWFMVYIYILVPTVRWDFNTNLSLESPRILFNSQPRSCKLVYNPWSDLISSVYLLYKPFRKASDVYQLCRPGPWHLGIHGRVLSGEHGTLWPSKWGLMSYGRTDLVGGFNPSEKY